MNLNHFADFLDAAMQLAGMTQIRKERLLRPQKVSELEFFVRDSRKELRPVLAWRMDWAPLDQIQWLQLRNEDEPDLELEQGLLHVRALQACGCHLALSVSSGGMLMSPEHVNDYDVEALYTSLGRALHPDLGLNQSFLQVSDEFGAAVLHGLRSDYEARTGEPSNGLVVGKLPEDGGCGFLDNSQDLGTALLGLELLKREFFELTNLGFDCHGEFEFQGVTAELEDAGMRRSKAKAPCVLHAGSHLDFERLQEQGARYVFEMDLFSISLAEHKKAHEMSIVVVPAFLTHGAAAVLAECEHQMGLSQERWTDEHLFRRTRKALLHFYESARELAGSHKVSLAEGLVLSSIQSLEKRLETHLA